MSKKLWLIAGVPCAGKSHFCEWLEKEHSFRHYNVDLTRKDGGHLRDDNLLDLWKECREQGKVGPFVKAVRSLNRDTVLEFGFSGLFELSVVQGLRELGF